MALWKPFRGNRADLDAVEKHDGYVYFCIDDGTLHFDYTDVDGSLQRKQINAKDAEALTGVSLEALRTEFTNQDTVILAEAQDYTNQVVEAVKGDMSAQDAVVLYEAQAYTDTAVENLEISSSNKDAVVLAEAQKGIDAVRADINIMLETKVDINYVDNAIAQKSQVQIITWGADD